MPESTCTFTARDGITLFSRRWEPEGPIRGEIFGLHGLLEHCGRYADFARHLNAAGYALQMIDHRGHGRSEGPRLYIDRIETLVDDFDGVLRQWRERRGRDPDFLFGHSMGAGVLILHAATRRATVRGAVLSGPPIRIAARVLPPLRHLAVLLSFLWPRFRLARLRTAERLGAHAVSRNPDVIQALRDDPLVFRGRFPVRTAVEILDLPGKLMEAAAKFDLPYLFLQGGADKLSAASGARDFHERSPSPDKTLRIYPGLYHEVLSEPEKDVVLREVVEWLNARNTSPTP
ncbi:alpha/beta hydrolase [Thermopirellula anaerolimosa]